MAENGQKIEKQIVLPVKNALQMSIRSIRSRFGRSSIVTMSIVFGIAFFMSVMANNAFIASILKSGPESLKVILQQNSSNMGARQIWLIALSLVVCTVGIINSMLMSVTERSREIGTMKCLGALDHFVVELFLIEAFIQGIIGSIIGIVIGVLFTTLSVLFQYKGIIFSLFPVIQILKYSLMGLILGTFLTIIGALYPSYLSARMEPAEAIRREV
ncbi:MAG: FtsX-like permease family protein [Candidatus Omnitrophica bacterium]|nr:FtsX-like permease family protein [Candidatus Omnitrophota bacterium]